MTRIALFSALILLAGCSAEAPAPKAEPAAKTETGAMGEFFITTSAMPSMDASGDDEGYAAFGKVVEGMDVVRRILASPTVKDAGRGAMRGQMLEKPVPIVSARRVE